MAQPETIARAAINIKHAASFLLISSFLSGNSLNNGFVAIYEFLNRVVDATDPLRAAGLSAHDGDSHGAPNQVSQSLI